MAYVDKASETTRAVLRRNPLHIHRPPIDRPPDWRRDDRQIGSNSAYGAWVDGGDVASQHLNDLRMARNYMQFGMATASRETARPKTTAAPLEEQADFAQDHFESRAPHAERHSQQGGSDFWPRSSPSQSPAAGRHGGQPRPPKALYCNLMGPGDVTPSQGFPGAPGASRGLPQGGHALWSFERMPSLLHGPLDRDRGKHARSCAGDPPALRSMKEVKERLPPQAYGDSLARQSDQMSPSSQGMRESRSESSLLARRPEPKKYNGLHGLVGMSWDDAKVAAGGALRGSDGRYLGY